MTKTTGPVTIHAEDLVTAWKKMCRHILSEGFLAQPILTGDSGTVPGLTREAVNVVLTIEDTYVSSRTLDVMNTTHPADVIKWMKALWTRGEAPEGIDRTYAVRVYDYGGEGLDQVARIIDLLSRDQESRRGVIALSDPRIDDPSTPASIPCLSTIHFLIRDGAIKTNIYFRSWDAGKKLLPDLVGIADVRDEVSQNIGVPLGELTVFVGSVHIYDNDVEWVTSAVSDTGT